MNALIRSEADTVSEIEHHLIQDALPMREIEHDFQFISSYGGHFVPKFYPNQPFFNSTLYTGAAKH